MCIFGKTIVLREDGVDSIPLMHSQQLGHVFRPYVQRAGYVFLRQWWCELQLSDVERCLRERGLSLYERVLVQEGWELVKCELESGQRSKDHQVPKIAARSSSTSSSLTHPRNARGVNGISFSSSGVESAR